MYGGFLFVLVLFLTYLHVLTLAWNLGARFDMIQVLIPAMALLFYAAGVMLRNAKQNWFIGIRTPWTLTNETVWDRTHQAGGRVFKLAAVIMLLGVFFPGYYALLFIMVPVLGAALYAVVYSYVAYQAVTR
jgi:uncharacterized membrane protein